MLLQDSNTPDYRTASPETPCSIVNGPKKTQLKTLRYRATLHKRYKIQKRMNKALKLRLKLKLLKSKKSKRV